MIRPLRYTLASLFSVALLASAGTAQALTYDFTSDAQGWTATGASLSGQVPVGGNPGGFFGLTDALLGGAPEMFASVAPGGVDLSSAAGGTVSFDFRWFVPTMGSPGLSNAEAGRVYLSNGATTVSADLFSNGDVNSSQGGAWQTFAGALTGATFGTSDSTLLGVLSNVTQIRIMVDPRMSGASSTLEAVGLDNVTIAAVPEPHEWAMMLAGLGLVGWVAGRRRRAADATAFA